MHGVNHVVKLTDSWLTGQEIGHIFYSTHRLIPILTRVTQLTLTSISLNQSPTSPGVLLRTNFNIILLSTIRSHKQ
jgi:hypothetical protein